jgi:nucleoid DNA-binding protein
MSKNSRKTTAVKEAMTKSEIYAEMAANLDVTKKQVGEFFEEFSTLVERHIKPRSVGAFSLPGMFKIVVQKKPATKARKGINPFTGEETMFKAKPARKAVKVKPLKKLKDMVD